MTIGNTINIIHKACFTNRFFSAHTKSQIHNFQGKKYPFFPYNIQITEAGDIDLTICKVFISQTPLKIHIIRKHHEKDTKTLKYFY
ncbi:hypothetical protein XELAEV_18016640mg [Xenopus laevis]|uniref:Uncharacterized protein n=1 Tax=Xenopus laevis TaxID=8355 RepID=A0A974DC58_XENLA|nr:hypothetical protein XELAEV_18016640mg [Xenopus laevis]